MGILKISAKCSDLCWTEYEDSKGNVTNSDSYVPEGIGISDDGDCGDYVSMEIDMKTGQILNWKPVQMKAMKRLIAKNIKIEFSCFKHENNIEATAELFDSINEILERELPDINFKISGSITENEVSETIKYHTDPTGHCEVLCKNTVIARAYVGGDNGYEVRVLQGLPREATMQKIREDCPEFLIANNVPDNYSPKLFGAPKKKK